MAAPRTDQTTNLHPRQFQQQWFLDLYSHPSHIPPLQLYHNVITPIAICITYRLERRTVLYIPPRASQGSPHFTLNKSHSPAQLHPTVSSASHPSYKFLLKFTHPPYAQNSILTSFNLAALVKFHFLNADHPVTSQVDLSTSIPKANKARR